MKTAADAAMSAKGPDFLCIGVQKAGTTWLDEMLKRHAQVWLPPVKELHYFSEVYLPNHVKHIRAARDTRIRAIIGSQLARKDKANFALVRTAAHIGTSELTDSWYCQIFASAPPAKMSGEISPLYIMLPPEGIEHLVRVNPNAKIILILREPVSRAWSHARMTIGNKSIEDPKRIRKIVLGRDVVDRGRYRGLLEAWKGAVSPDRLFIGLFDDIASQPLRFLERLCDFLDISFSADVFPKAHATVHAGARIPLPLDLESELKLIYKNDIEYVADTIGGASRNWTR